MEEEQPIVPEDIPDGRTCFVVGDGVGEFVIVPESLALFTGADSACNVEFFRDDVFPDFIDGIDVALVPSQSSHIRHPRIHVRCPHSVSDSFVLFDDRFVGLEVPVLIVDGEGGGFRKFFFEFLLTPFIQEKFGQVQVFFLSC